VIVIGAGISGVAAAWAATKSGAQVTVILGGAGASSLSSGALDGSSEGGWADVAPFVATLELWQIAPCRLATQSGLVRAASGRDLALLDLESIEAGTVAVVGVKRRGWDAEALAHAWTSEPWAVDHGLRFEATAVEGLLRADEEILPVTDLAARHDDPERVGWLIARLRESAALARARAVVMGPWLGLRRGVAAEIARGVGKPIGEPLSLPGGVSGLRFDRARDAILAELGVEIIADWAERVESANLGASVTLASGSVLGADAIVLASGGLASGGVAWSPENSSQGFTTSPRQPGSLAMHGEPLRSSGSPEGALFETMSWRGGGGPSGFERVGIWTDRRCAVRLADGSVLSWLYAAGDLAADAPRDMLHAIRSGVAAGSAAGSATSSA
jgi:glycerol-3-phosphate dehydrogenase subunit B